MATITFFLRGANELKTIYVRFRSSSNVDLKASIGKRVEEKYWNHKKGELNLKDNFIGKTELMERISLINDSIKKKVLTVKSSSQYTQEWLRDVISNFDKEEVAIDDTMLLIDAIDKYKIELKKKNKNIHPGTLRNYNTTIGRIKKWEEELNRPFYTTELDLTFHANYVKFAQEELKISLNSVGRDIRNIKAVCSYISELGIRVHTNVSSRKFYAPSEKTLFTTLSEEELDKLIKLNGADYINNARDWLIIGCWVGARVEDLLNLTNNNIIEYNGQKIIRYTQSKVDKTVAVPIHPNVRSILEKNNGFPRKISAVKFNEYIKLACKSINLNEPIEGLVWDEKLKRNVKGIHPKWRLIRSHTCRRSFATNHYNSLPNKVIMAVTGHTTERMLLKYIGEIEVDHIDKFFDAWNVT